MEFKNYCINVMGNTEGILTEVNKISEKVLGNMNAKGLVIITFTSVMEINELTDFFKECKRNFLLFIINSKTSGYGFIKQHQNVEDELFGNIEPNELKLMTNNLLNSLKTNKIDNNLIENGELSEEDIKKLGKEGRENLFNEIIEKSFINDYDKDILDKLTKYK